MPSGSIYLRRPIVSFGLVAPGMELSDAPAVPPWPVFPASVVPAPERIMLPEPVVPGATLRCVPVVPSPCDVTGRPSIPGAELG